MMAGAACAGGVLALVHGPRVSVASPRQVDVREAMPARETAPRATPTEAFGPDAGRVEDAAGAVASWPRRVPREGAPWCRRILRDDGRGHFLAQDDLVLPGGALVADGRTVPVSRRASFGLDPDAAPDDLVDARTGVPRTVAECYPPGGQCLRRDAAAALGRLSAAMRAAGEVPHIHSAFRSYEAQCATFLSWAFVRGQGFCGAVEGSALPGHSQHQLGTAVDFFSERWAHDGPVMRPGFGCTRAGRWLAAESWRYGFVLPYPAPLRAGRRQRCAVSSGPDPRTGYQYEPWHMLYVGEDVAAAYHAAAEASDGALVFEAWQRRQRGEDDDAGLPLCDGCACGWCSTVAPQGQRSPCGARALRVDAEGRALLDPAARPALASVAWVDARVAVVRVTVPSGVVTMSPVSVGELVNLPDHPPLPDTWRLTVDAPSGGRRYRVALASGRPPAWVNGAPRRLPTTAGEVSVRVALPEAGPWRFGLEGPGEASVSTR